MNDEYFFMANQKPSTGRFTRRPRHGAPPTVRVPQGYMHVVKVDENGNWSSLCGASFDELRIFDREVYDNYTMQCPMCDSELREIERPLRRARRLAKWAS